MPKSVLPIAILIVLAGAAYAAMSYSKPKPNQSTTTRTEAVSTEAAAAEQQFMEQMVSHHADAIAMAQMSAEKAQTKAVKTMSSNIISTQQKELAEMKSWYQQWFDKALPEMANMSGMSEESGQMMNRLRTASDFDLEFVKQMTVHHQNAIKMAQDVLPKAQHQPLKDLATSIFATQSAEVSKMQQLQQQFEQNSPGSAGRATL